MQPKLILRSAVRWAAIISTALLFEIQASAQVSTGTVAKLCEALMVRSQPPPFDESLILQVMTTLEDHWRAEFAARGWPFRPAKVAPYRLAAISGCGLIESHLGPAYCVHDDTIYLDPWFFVENRHAVGTESKAFLTFVLAHEYGHHIQNVRGARDSQAMFAAATQSPYAASRYFSENQEYQADCLAGVFLKGERRRLNLTDDHLIESVVRMALMGDDVQGRLHGRSPQEIQSQPYSHGTSAGRMTWMLMGLSHARVEACEPMGIQTLSL